MRSSSLLLGSILLAAACGGGSDEGVDATTSPATTSEPPAIEPESADAPSMNAEPVTVESDDGLVTLEIPAGAMASETEVSVVVTDDTALGTYQADSFVYDLQPDGLQFAEAATIEFRMPVDEEAAGGIPLVIGVLESGGRVEPTGRNEVRAEGDAWVVAADIAHFSRLTFFNSRLIAVLDPPSVSTTPDSEFVVRLETADLDPLPGLNLDGLSVRDATWGASGQVTLDDSYLQEADYICGTGRGSYGVTFTAVMNEDAALAPEDSVWKLLLVGENVIEVGGILFGEADCTGTQCELDPSDPSRPSIGRTGAAAAEVAPEVVGDANQREVGFGILQLVDDAELCLTDVVEMVDELTASPDMEGAIEQVVDSLFG